MAFSYDLTHLDPNAFEHLVNALALRVLGSGHTGFGPGPDGGRDGYFQGEAPYPSNSDRWSGIWYIQAKFQSPKLGGDPQKWLLDQIQAELNEFAKPQSKRIWPDNWIFATNVNPSAVPSTGSFDRARALVEEKRPELKDRFHIWGGTKILQLLSQHPEVRDYYGHFLTPGHVLSELYHSLRDDRAEVDQIINFLVVRGLTENQYTKLEQAGASSDTRPGIHHLFIDLPFSDKEHDINGFAANFLARTLARNHRIDTLPPNTREWRFWNRYPSRARAWFLKGGPGQGKSTIGQFVSQIHRAALVLEEGGPRILPRVRQLAEDIRVAAAEHGLWPSVPRIPILIELREYAQWYGRRNQEDPRGVLTYLAEKIAVGVEQKVLAGTLRRTLAIRSWFAIFDGLDEVPHDVKDDLAREIHIFMDHVVVEINADLVTLCTSRPQGYSGQFSDLDAPTLVLTDLSPEQALACASPVLRLDRSDSEAAASLDILSSAIKSKSVQELMTTPLQSHIMAVVVRDGGRPPERRWQLFTNFYHVIRRREANRNLPDPRLARLLREEEQLLKTVHNRLGFVLHARAETSQGAQTRLNRGEFRTLVKQAVYQMIEGEVDHTVDVLMNATTERLVLVSTPDDGQHLRFDVRPLQEFFAAEYLYESVSAEELGKRVEVIGGDPHWREVIHFLLSALVESGRRTELTLVLNALTVLDEGTDELDDRLLSRRLARGGLLCARLIEEGVLEQDKRYREQVKPCILSLCGLVDPTALQPLGHIRHEHSRRWLLRFLLSAVREFTHSENIGSAIVLSLLLSDEDDQRDEMTGFLLTAPANYLSYVIACRLHNAHHHARTYPPQKWLIRTLIQLLRGPKWLDLGTSGISSALSLISFSPQITLEVAAEIGMSASEITFLKEAMNMPPYQESETIRYGAVEAAHYRYDWTTGIRTITPVSSLALSDTSVVGFLQLIQKVLRFAQQRSYTTMLDLITFLDQPDGHILFVVPDHLQAYVPVDRFFMISDQLSQLRALDEDGFELLIEKRQLGSRELIRPSRHFTFTGTTDPSEWIRSLSVMPSLVTDLLWSRTIADESEQSLMDALVELVLELPRLLLISVPQWGTILTLNPHRERELRSAIRAAASSDEAEWYYEWPGEFSPFELDLPSDAPLLPHLITALLGGEIELTTLREEVNSPDLQQVRSITMRYIPDVAQLEALIADRTQPLDVYLAASLLASIHPESSSKSLRRLPLETSILSDREWYIRAIVMYLRIAGKQSDEDVRYVILRLLEAVRDNYDAREVIQQLLSTWREESLSPVSSRGLIETWLVN